MKPIDVDKSAKEARFGGQGGDECGDLQQMPSLLQSDGC